MNCEYVPKKIRIDSSSDNEWFDDEKFTHAKDDVLYIRADSIWEYILEQGYNMTITTGTKDNGR